MNNFEIIPKSLAGMSFYVFELFNAKPELLKDYSELYQYLTQEVSDEQK